MLALRLRKNWKLLYNQKPWKYAQILLSNYMLIWKVWGGWIWSGLWALRVTFPQFQQLIVPRPITNKNKPERQYWDFIIMREPCRGELVSAYGFRLIKILFQMGWLNIFRKLSVLWGNLPFLLETLPQILQMYCYEVINIQWLLY